MATPTDVLAFYAEAHWGSRYGAVDVFHLTPHKGIDCGLFHGDVLVPALHEGTVVAAAANPNVGHYVTVQRGDGLFDTYCHIVLAVSVGQRVTQGQTLGRQAVTPAEGGIQWKGQHTHLCLSRTRDGWGVWGYVNLDPTPGVVAVLTTAASINISQLDNSQPEPEEEEDDMANQPITLEIVNKDNSKQWAQVYVVEKVWVPIWTADAANALSTAFKTLIPVNKTEWNGYRAQCGLPADTTVGK